MNALTDAQVVERVRELAHSIQTHGGAALEGWVNLAALYHALGEPPPPHHRMSAAVHLSGATYKAPTP